MTPNIKPICVIGSIVYDFVMTVDHLPVTGETVPASGFATFIGGKGLNQAMQIHRLGSPLRYFGRIGDDRYGADVMEVLESERFPTNGIRKISGEHTAIGMIFVAPDGRNLIAGYRAANMSFPVSEINDELKSAIRSASYVSCQLETPDDVVLECFRLAKESGARTILNAAPYRDLPVISNDLVDFWLVNEIEASQFFKCSIENADDCQAITSYPHVRDSRQVWVVTLGEKGAAVVDSDGVHPISGIKVSAVDSTGAGDSFTGGFIVGLHDGLGHREAAEFANRVASISVTKLGGMTGLPTRAEVLSQTH